MHSFIKLANIKLCVMVDKRDKILIRMMMIQLDFDPNLSMFDIHCEINQNQALEIQLVLPSVSSSRQCARKILT